MVWGEGGSLGALEVGGAGAEGRSWNSSGLGRRQYMDTVGGTGSKFLQDEQCRRRK